MKSNATFRRKLLQWYDKNKRDLPWRRTQDPYAIWVSEIMLQQTQVATVLPYYAKFLKKFPTLQSLAGATEEEVLSLWSGLGYYRRAKLLKSGAETVQAEWKGILPAEPAALREIPGIGPYTAGAIASIAFNRPAPLVDGNVIRVFSRLFMLKGHAKSATLQKQVWELAAELIDEKNPGDFNQALMELGATVCRVVQPRCESCPVRTSCRASQESQPEQFPETPPNPKTIRLRRVVGLCRQDDQILLVKRVKPRWFQGMWELPHEYINPEDDALTTLQNFLRTQLGVSLKNLRTLPNTSHSITHHRIATLAWLGQTQGQLRPKKSLGEAQFFPLDRLESYPLSNFDRKVLQVGAKTFSSEPPPRP